VEIPESLVNKYSNSKKNNLNYSNSNCSPVVIFSKLSDVVPEDKYTPFYVKKLRQLGVKRFVELANKARQRGNDPARLFFWMLKNHKLVK
jgi:hypothetical protein